MIKCRCSHCHALLGLDDHLAGHKIRCPKCHEAMVASPEAEPVSAARPDQPQPPHASDNPLEAIAHAEAAQEAEDADRFAGQSLGHGRHHRVPKRRQNNTTLILIIVGCLVLGFLMGFLTGGAYKHYSITTSGRLLPEGQTVKQIQEILDERAKQQLSAPGAAAESTASQPTS